MVRYWSQVLNIFVSIGLFNNIGESIDHNFNHMIRNISRHIVKLVATKQSLLMEVISKPESRFNHECRISANAALFKGEMIKRVEQALSSRTLD